MDSHALSIQSSRVLMDRLERLRTARRARARVHYSTATAANNQTTRQPNPFELEVRPCRHWEFALPTPRNHWLRTRP